MRLAGIQKSYFILKITGQQIEVWFSLQDVLWTMHDESWGPDVMLL